MSRLRNCCITINCSTEKEPVWDPSKMRYLVYSQESGGTTGYLHWQCYVEFANPRRLPEIKKIFGETVHVEPRKGTAKQAADYCKKSDTRVSGPYEFGEISCQGKRSDLEEAIETLQTGGINAVIENHPESYVKFHKGLEKLALVKQPHRNFKPTVIWILGPTGIGKTRSVFDQEPVLWVSGRNLKWWDGYENQPAVLFDDFRADFCTYHELLRILDRYPYDVEVKGSHRRFNSQRIYITSCFHPKYVYNTREDIGQLLRRIDEIRDLTPPPAFVNTEDGVEL